MTQTQPFAPRSVYPPPMAETRIDGLPAPMRWIPISDQPGYEVGLPLDVWARTEGGFELRYPEQPPIYQMEQPPADTSWVRMGPVSGKYVGRHRRVRSIMRRQP